MPLSLAAAVLVLRAFGATINTMTLGGMAIAIGALVDDAIIDVENVVRRLRENAREAARASSGRRPTVVRDATLEIRTSIVFATIIIVLVFLPIFGLAGVEGRLLTPLAFAYIVSLLASLVVAIVVTPALCYAFLPERAIDPARPRRLAGADAEGALRAGPAARARSSAARDRRCRWRCSLVAARGDRRGWARVPAGVPRRQPDRAGQHAAGHVAGEVGRDRTARRADPARRSPRSSPRRGGPAAPSSTSTCRASRRPRSTSACARRAGRARELLADLRRGFSTLPGTNVTIGQPISHRIDHMLSGTRANIAVKVFGDDLRHAAAARRARARSRQRRARRRRPVARAADGRPVRALRAEPAGDRPLRPARGRRRAKPSRRASPGATVGRIFDRGTAFDLVVKFDPASQRRLRAHRRSADRHADGRSGADSAAGRRPARRGAEHDPARERAAPDRDLVQRRRTRSRQRRRRHPNGRRAVGADAGGLSRRVRRPVREPAERVAAAAGPGRRRHRRPVHAARAGVRPRRATRC